MEAKKLGFGLMRLPCLNNDAGDIDIAEVSRMVDKFISEGFNYFDTSYVYHNGKSENATRKALVERYPRDSFLLATKFPTFNHISSVDEVDKIFKSQLEQCGVTYFDYYMLHNLDENRYLNVAEKYNLFEYVARMKEKGFIKHIGFSIHDSAEMIDRILCEHPEMEFVQIAANYHDWDKHAMQAGACYEVIRKHKKQVIIMEPVKGGTLSNLPPEADKLLKEYNPSASSASWAMRFCFDLEDVITVLSGMSTMQQVEDNTQVTLSYTPLNETEKNILKLVVEILGQNPPIACDDCGKCNEGCPKHIPISECHAYYNESILGKNPTYYGAELNYYKNLVRHCGSAADCDSCGACEAVCPRQLKIAENMNVIAAFFKQYNYD